MTGPREIREIPKPVDVQAALAEIGDELVHLPTDCALIGGMALAYYGIERYTKEVDLAVTTASSAALERRLEGRDVQPLRIGGISVAAKNGVRVDLIDRRFEYRALFEEAIEAAKTGRSFARIGAHEVPVVPLHFLVAMKMAADRPQDETDVALILARDDLDYAKARAIVYGHLGHYAARRLDRAARLAGRSGVREDYENS